MNPAIETPLQHFLEGLGVVLLFFLKNQRKEGPPQPFHEVVEESFDRTGVAPYCPATAGAAAFASGSTTIDQLLSGSR